MLCLYNTLAKVPSLSRRLKRVSYDLTSGCAPYGRNFGALIMHSLSITKSLTKKLASTRIILVPSDLYSLTCTPDAQPSQHLGYSSHKARNVVYVYYQLCLGYGFTGMFVKLRQESSTPWHSKHHRWQTTAFTK